MAKGTTKLFHCIRCGKPIGRRTYFANEYDGDFTCPYCKFGFSVGIPAGDTFPKKADLVWGPEILDLYYCPFGGKGNPGDNILKSAKNSDSTYNYRCVNQKCKREFAIIRDDD